MTSTIQAAERLQESREYSARRAVAVSRPVALALWFLAGTAFGVIVMAAYASGRGGWTHLLNVGANNPLLYRLESELGPLAPADATGHDGQLYYLVARDPLGTGEGPQAIAQFDDNGPQYRYRRILFPLLAGGFGQLAGRATLYGMIAWLAVAMGLATVAIADLSFQLNVRGGAVLGAVANAGVLVSLLLLTADALAIGLALAGVSLALRSRTAWAVAAFALAALTKEVYLLVPWALAAWHWKERQRGAAVALALVPALPIIVWSGWVEMSLPSSPTSVENIGVPLIGLFEAVSFWVRHERIRLELFLATFIALTFIAAGIMLVVGRISVLRWLVAPWVALGCVSTLEVWGKPNNAARVFAILWPLSVLLLSERVSDWRKRNTGHTGSDILVR
jgi:hypothetical protein